MKHVEVHVRVFQRLMLLLYLIPFLVSSQLLSIIQPINPSQNPESQSSSLPSFPQDALTEYTFSKPRIGFVTTHDRHFYLNDQLFDFRSLNAPTLVPGPSIYEATDIFRSIAGFGSPVTRSYTLAIANDRWGLNQDAQHAHISGWDSKKNDWIYVESVWRKLDKTLALAAEEGVKIIFPIINQDYGHPETDFVGNFVDLIRHRYNITSYSEAQLRVDWFVDRSIRDDFKKIIRFMLTRKNTVNGRIYGEDDTFLAFETGNEMNWGQIHFNDSNINIHPSQLNLNQSSNHPITSNSSQHPSPRNSTSFTLTHTRPAPADWTIEIAKLMKSLAPNILVMDGSYARNKDVDQAWPLESLQSEFIDLFSYHFYGDSDAEHVPACQARIESFGKTFVVGEHGFYSNSSVYKSFYESFNGAGALIWSLRGHFEVSGFKTHSEGNNIYSLHVPGFKNQTSKLFDQLEYDIISQTYQASFDILGKPPAKFPIPGPPHAFFATNETSTGISFKGSAWAHHYEVWGAAEAGTFVKVADEVYDNVEEGKLLIAINPNQPQEALYVPPLSYIEDLLPQTGYVDQKWSDQIEVSLTSSSLLSPPHRRRSHESISTFASRSKASLVPFRKRSGEQKGRGAWYAVRGISVDGEPGVFSSPAFISASDDV